MSTTIMGGFFGGGGGSSLDASLYLQKAGGTMLGPLMLHADPTLPLMAATKDYVDANSVTLTAIELEMPQEFIVTGSPVDYDGKITVELAEQQPHHVFAGPASGTVDAEPTFRLLVAADISDLSDVTDLYLPLTGGSLTGSLDITGDLSETGDLAVGGDADVTGKLEVGGDTTLTGKLDVGDDASIDGRLKTGYLQVTNSGLAPTDGEGLEIFYGGGHGEIVCYDRNVDQVNVFNLCGYELIFKTGATGYGSLEERVRINEFGRVGIGNDASVSPYDSPTNNPVDLIVGSSAAPGTNYGRISMIGNAASDNIVGQLTFGNYAIASSQKRIASISGYVGSTNDTGFLRLSVWNVGTQVHAMYIRETGNVGIGNDASVLIFPPAADNYPQLIVGPTTGTSNVYGAIAVTTSKPGGGNVGEFAFCNHAIAGTRKRIASIFGSSDGAADAGALRFYTWETGAASGSERMQINSKGDVGIGNDASEFPLSVAATHGLQCVVGRTTPHSMTGNTGATRFSVVGNTQLGGVICANLQFANYAITAANKGLAAINVITDGADYNSGHMLFVTKNGSTWSEVMRITSTGNIGVWNDGTMVSNAPGYPQMIVGSPNIGGGYGFIAVAGNRTASGDAIGGVAFVNFANTGVDKRIAQITGLLGTSINSGNMVFYTYNAGSNVERMRITQLGHVGIGTDALVLPQASGLRSLIIGNSTGATNYGCVAIVANTANTSAAVGDLTFANYNITAAEKRLAVITGRTDGAIDNGALAFYTMTDGSVSGTEKLRISHNGCIGINFSSPTYILDINYIRSDDYGFRLSGPYGPILMDVSTAAGSSRYMLQLARDSAAKPGTNTWTIASDPRCKRNTNRFEGDIEVIRRLDPQVSEYNGRGGTPDGTRVVSLDPEVLREIVPTAVSSVRAKLDENDGEETELLGVNTHEIFYHMLRAVQQLDRRLQELEARR